MLGGGRVCVCVYTVFRSKNCKMWPSGCCCLFFFLLKFLPTSIYVPERPTNDRKDTQQNFLQKKKKRVQFNHIYSVVYYSEENTEYFATFIFETLEMYVYFML